MSCVVQAVQLLPEHQVCPGQHLAITASHDTYAISFAITPPLPPARAAAAAATEGANSGTAPSPTGVPFFDAAWKAAYDAVSDLQSRLAKALIQDPLEYRRLVNAALSLAMRPWGETGSGHDGCLADGKASIEHVARQLQQVTGGLPGKEVQPAQGAGCCSTPGPHVEADPHHAAALLVRLMS